MLMTPLSSWRGSVAGMVLAAVSFALLTAMDTIFKIVSLRGHPAYQILFFNGCFALLPVLGWTFATGGFARLATVRLPQHAARAAINVVSTFAAIYAYSRLPLTDFYAIVFAGPLVVTTMAAFWLGEKIEPARWAAIGVGFCGILIVTNPLQSPLIVAQDAGLEPHQAAALLGRFAAFASVFCYALSIIILRRMRGGETNLSFSFYGYVTSITICGLLYFFRGAAEFSFNDIAHLALSGVLSGISSICMMTAYHRTPVALVAPFQYTQIIWGALAGYLLWQHVPDGHLLAGSAIIAVSGLFVIYREMRAQPPIQR